MRTRTRRHTRVHCGVPGEIASAVGKLNGVVLNISRGGTFFIAGRMLPVGATVELLIRLPGIEPIHAHGCVRHHTRQPEGDGMGIEFTDLTDDQQWFIGEFVNARVGFA